MKLQAFEKFVITGSAVFAGMMVLSEPASAMSVDGVLTRLENPVPYGVIMTLCFIGVKALSGGRTEI